MKELFQHCLERSWLIAAVTTVALVGLSIDTSVEAQDESVPHQVRVVWETTPATEALISWSTTSPGDVHQIYYDTNSRDELSAYQYQSAEVTSGDYDAGQKYYHHARIEDLKPSTAYWFTVVTDDRVSEEFWFVTGPDDDRPFKLLYGGDSRSDPGNRRLMNARIAALVEGDPSIIALAHGGDYIATASSWSQWNQWLDDHQHTITTDGRILPILPARGNHEGNGAIYNRVFGFPGGEDLNYWTTHIGNDTVYITLNSEISQAGDQRDWLEQELQKAQDYQWVLANYHRPAYPAVKTPGGALEHWIPLFEQYNVDVVCESDGHSLKRTPPIRDGEMADDGVVYIGEGGLGVSQRTPDTDRWYLQPPGMAMSAHHVQVLSFHPDQILYEAVLMDGEVEDNYTFEPRRDGNYQPLEAISASLIERAAVEVQFSKPAGETSVTDVANYRFEPAHQINGVTFDTASNTAVLETEPFEAGTFSLQIDGVLDLADKPMTDATFTLEVEPDEEMPQDAEENLDPTETDPPQGEEPDPAENDDETADPDDPAAAADDDPVRIGASGQVCSTSNIRPTAPVPGLFIFVMLVVGGLVKARR